MRESFYQILAKTDLSEEDRKKLEGMFKRLEEEHRLLKEVFSDISLVNKRILDIGTGQGFACKYLVENARESLIVTIDIDPLCLNRVRNIVGEKINDIVFIKADLSDLSFIKANFFDIALSHDTLTTIEMKKMYDVLKEIHRVLSPGGLFIVVDGFGLGKVDEARKLTLKLEEIHHQLTGDEEEVDLEDLLTIFKDFSKFKVLEVKKLNEGRIDPTIEDYAYYLLSLTDDPNLKKIILEICKKGSKIGFREAPDYAIYLQKI